MGLKFDPIGGGQFKKALEQIAEAERAPIKNLEARKAKQETKFKLFQEFKTKMAQTEGAVNAISNFRNLREFKIDLGDGKDLMDVTVDKTKVQPGSYQMEIKELADRASMISNGFSDPEEKMLGIGFIVIDLPDGDTFEVFVDEADSSLHGVAGLINDIKNAPIQASVIKDAYDPERPFRLLLSAKVEGDKNALEFPEFYFMSGKSDFWVENDRSAKNALLSVDGFEVDGESNDIADFIDGVNIHMKQAKEGQPFTLNISVDYEKVSGKVKTVVEKVNDVLKFINAQNKIDDTSDTSVMFSGDTSLQSIEYRLRNLLHEAFPAGSYEDDTFRLVHLSQLGIELSKDGSVTFNENKFKAMSEKDFQGVAEALSGEQGFAFQLGEVMKLYTRGYDGLLASREKGMRERIRQIDDTIANREKYLERKMQNLTGQFSRLQSTLGALQSQQGYLQATLGGNGSSNLVSQLLGS